MSWKVHELNMFAKSKFQTGLFATIVGSCFNYFLGQPEIDIALKLSDVVYEETEEGKYKVGLVCAIFK